MNTILQKRIEEAAKNLVNYNLVDLGDLVNQYDLLRMLIEMGVKTLQNQWISVNEASPEADIPNCFVAYRAIDMVLYSTGSYEKDRDEWYVDGVGFNAEVTHYMPIPSLEGGEK